MDTVSTITAARSRSYDWDDPMPLSAQSTQMSGLDFLRGLLADGRTPPICRTMDFHLAEVEEGRAVWKALPAEFHYNPIGVVHGGFFATVLDSAMGCAVHSTLPAGAGYTTLEFKINLVRPLTFEVGEIVCDGWVVHRGARIATAEARLSDSGGKIYAHASCTCMIFQQPPAA